MTQTVTVHLTNSVVQEIHSYQQATRKQSFEEAVTELLQYALTSFPPYFRQFNWEQAEIEADHDIQTGRVHSFSTADDFLADLKA